MTRILSALLSIAVLVAIYLQIDAAAVRDLVSELDMGLTLAALSILLPIALMIAWRLYLLSPSRHDLSYTESLRVTLAANVLNTFLPSRLGDIAKSYFLVRNHGVKASEALALVTFEKSCDLLALLGWCSFGLLFYGSPDVYFWVALNLIVPAFGIGVLVLASKRGADFVFRVISKVLPEKIGGMVLQFRGSWIDVQEFIVAQPRRAFIIVTTSIVLWFVHLVQFWLFLEALGARVPLLTNMVLTPLAILVGLLPFTIAGVGTRDAAFIILFADHLDTAPAAALGLFATVRYVIPACVGLPFVSKYLAAHKE